MTTNPVSNELIELAEFGNKYLTALVNYNGAREELNRLEWANASRFQIEKAEQKIEYAKTRLEQWASLFRESAAQLNA
jgi:hypothetical protein